MRHYGIFAIEGNEKKIVRKCDDFNNALMERNVVLRGFQSKGFSIERNDDIIQARKGNREVAVCVEQI